MRILGIFCFLIFLCYIEGDEITTTVEPPTTIPSNASSSTESLSSLITTESTLQANTTLATTTSLPKDDVNGTKEVKKDVLKDRGYLNTSDYHCECDVTVSPIS